MKTYYLEIEGKDKPERYKFDAANDKKAIRNANRIAGNRTIAKLYYKEQSDSTDTIVDVVMEG